MTDAGVRYVMPQILAKLFSNPGVRKAFVALVLAVLAALGVSIGAGCNPPLPARAAKALATYECQVRALESVVPLAVAQDLVMAARAGNGSYVVQQLLGLGLTPEDIRRAADEFRKCSDSETAPAPAINPVRI